MKSDYASRLRAFEGSDELGNGDFSICWDAADEIERLRNGIIFAASYIESGRDLTGMADRLRELAVDGYQGKASDDIIVECPACRERFIVRDNGEIDGFIEP